MALSMDPITPPLTPPEQPCAMPVQDLLLAPLPLQSMAPSRARLPRGVTFLGSATLMGWGCWQMAMILPLNEPSIVSSSWVSALLWMLWVLFSLTFAWVAFSAVSAMVGLLFGRDHYRSQTDAPLCGKTVLLMPIYNENTPSACAALGAMAQELAADNQQAHFEIFLISDTDDPDVLALEAEQVHRLQQILSSSMPVWYRHRAENSERKAGNIRDFVRRWGSRYDYMMVLDADSLMSANAVATLVREMDADDRLGLLQTLPRQYLGETFFARLQQFAGFAYGAVFARGLTAWQGHSGNYWGHNAIIRLTAFAEAAGLPVLQGRRPFGGEIRSHDFVEAALLRRVGWSVRMLPNLAGSWEECPRSLIELGIRDRRWAQGNMQHLAVLSARGLHWPNRIHMLMGVMSYLSSLFWLLLVMTGLALSAHFVIQQRLGVPWSFLPQFDFMGMIDLFFVTMVLLLMPKGFGLIRGLFSASVRGNISRFHFTLSVLLELLSAIIYAPMFMLIHSQHLWDIAWGHDSGWRTVRNGPARQQWSTLLRRHLGHTVIGGLLLIVLLWLASNLWYWMLPLVLGMVLAIPLSALSGSQVAAQGIARWGLLRIPEEQAPPSIHLRRQQLYQQLTQAPFAHQQPLKHPLKNAVFTQHVPESCSDMPNE